LAEGGRQKGRLEQIRHEGFLRHANFRWLKIAVAVALAAIAGYCLIDVQPRPRGGSWYGYLTGVMGASLILWLTLLGVRKRAFTRGHWSLKAWTSAHIYLGLALVVIATLHTGFSFGWNVHTLAYGLMILVVVSGLFGVVVYAALPSRMSENRGETTQRQILETLRSLDLQIHDAAQPLDRRESGAVRLSMEDTNIGGSLFERLSGVHFRCGTDRALRGLAQIGAPAPGAEAAALAEVTALLERKRETLALARRHMRLRATLEVWLYVHVPATFALLAALTAHIVSVFFYW
jgi:hypothetical protein